MQARAARFLRAFTITSLPVPEFDPEPIYGAMVMQVRPEESREELTPHEVQPSLESVGRTEVPVERRKVNQIEIPQPEVREVAAMGGRGGQWPAVREDGHTERGSQPPQVQGAGLHRNRDGEECVLQREQGAAEPFAAALQDCMGDERRRHGYVPVDRSPPEDADIREVAAAITVHGRRPTSPG